MNRSIIFALLAVSVGCKKPPYGYDTKRHILTIPLDNGHYLAVDLGSIHECDPAIPNELNGGSNCPAAPEPNVINHGGGCDCETGCGSACMPPPVEAKPK